MDIAADIHEKLKPYMVARDDVKPPSGKGVGEVLSVDEWDDFRERDVRRAIAMTLGRDTSFEASPTKPGGSRVQRRARAAQMRGKVN